MSVQQNASLQLVNSAIISKKLEGEWVLKWFLGQDWFCNRWNNWTFFDITGFIFNFHYYLLWAWNNLENGDISRARSNEHTATLRRDGIPTSLFGRTWGYIKWKDLKTGGRRPKTLFWYAGTMERNEFLSFMSLLPTLVWAKVTEVAQEDHRCTWCGRGMQVGWGIWAQQRAEVPNSCGLGASAPCWALAHSKLGQGTSLQWAASLCFPALCPAQQRGCDRETPKILERGNIMEYFVCKNVDACLVVTHFLSEKVLKFYIQIEFLTLVRMNIIPESL